MNYPRDIPGRITRIQKEYSQYGDTLGQHPLVTPSPAFFIPAPQHVFEFEFVEYDVTELISAAKARLMTARRVDAPPRRCSPEKALELASREKPTESDHKNAKKWLVKQGLTSKPKRDSVSTAIKRKEIS